MRTLLQGYYQPGHYTAVWDGKDEEGRSVTSGIYIYQLSMKEKGFAETRRMLLVK